jgi:oxygen-independent coproporphyrinogen-3 oxidase
VTSLALLKLPPLSLYIHIPWCIRKCPYCDFNSHQQDNVPEQEYIDCLLQDLDEELPNVQGRQLTSIFFGGGTPSIFSDEGIARIISEVKNRINFSSDIEITLEANPGTVEQDKFNGFYQAGVNRLSIGVQSFQAQKLSALGRIHTNDEAIRAAQSAIAANIDNFNLDLMHGLPQQTIDDALSDLQQAIDLNPKHISWYQLTIEKNTEFYNQPPTLPGEDSLFDIQAAGENLLQKNNFLQYEISAYCKEGKQSRHNLNYWQFGDYIGIGAGAHGKITNNSTIFRRQKTRQPKDYMNSSKPFCIANKNIPINELPFEFMLNALRLENGFSLDLFEQRTGLNKEILYETLERLKLKGLISTNTDLVRKTDQGKLFLNEVVSEFL